MAAKKSLSSKRAAAKSAAKRAVDSAEAPEPVVAQRVTKRVAKVATAGAPATTKSRGSAKTASTRGRRAKAVAEEYPPAAAGTTSLVIVESPAKAKTIGKYLGRA
jgi:hypothetical protein